MFPEEPTKCKVHHDSPNPMLSNCMLIKVAKKQKSCNHFQTNPLMFFRSKIPMFDGGIPSSVCVVQLVWMNSIKDKTISCCCCLSDSITIAGSALQSYKLVYVHPLTLYMYIWYKYTLVNNNSESIERQNVELFNSCYMLLSLASTLASYTFSQPNTRML